MAHSCLYEGFVRHRRQTPVEHAFDYPVFMFYLDLDEIDTVFSGRWLFSSTRRPAIGTFRDRDYVRGRDEPLADSVRRLVQENMGRSPDGPIRLLTQLRYFGYGFNPVSFFYCFSTDSQTTPMAIVAEINNTPWGEQHCYVLPVDSTDDSLVRSRRFELEKEFHISPFMSMDVHYDWRFTDPSDSLVVHMQNFGTDGRRFFDATLSLRKQPITTWTLNSKLVRYPLASAHIVARIYWNATKLLLKGAPVYEHPGHDEPVSSTGPKPSAPRAHS